MSVSFPSHDDASIVRTPFQFRLRTLLLAVALFSALFAVMDIVGALWSVVLVWFLLLVGAHVAANAWGTKVGRRGQADRLQEDTDQRPSDPSNAAVRRCLRVPPMTSSRLRQSTRLGRTMYVISGVGALIGAAVGTALLAVICLRHVGLAGLLVGGISSAVLGGFFGFLTSSFISVAGPALLEASRGSHSG